MGIYNIYWVKLTRLRTKHVKGMKISTDRHRSNTNHIPYCPNVQLSPQHTLSCPAIQVRLFKICLKDPKYLMFSDKAFEVAEAVFDSLRGF
ncbi:hypothetical protein TNCV_2848911 [Trichonephila clavipes]|nr:hypothetical protein TNCV_2848911 [Trichonephila clavipes]